MAQVKAVPPPIPQAARHPAEHDKEHAAAPDPVESASLAGLRYVTDAIPGIQRERAGDTFRYVGVDGTPVRDDATLARIKSLAIPPAWTDVWIAPTSRGHLQATGRDAKGRKQYRYHPRWRTVRDETKYDRMVAFGETLPRIRERVAHDLSLPGLPREKVLATVVQLLDETAMRVGNEEYARQNKSFGLTTLRAQHVDVNGPTLRFHFRGKSGKTHEVQVHDRRVARVVKRCQDLPGYELFQYLDEHNERHAIESADVNDYLRDVSGQEFTAKDFRTWAGTVFTYQALENQGEFESQAQAKSNVAQAIKVAAERLGNTPAICRKSYVHPGILDAYTQGSLLREDQQRQEQAAIESGAGLQPDEAEVLALLRTLDKETSQHARAG